MELTLLPRNNAATESAKASFVRYNLPWECTEATVNPTPVWVLSEPLSVKRQALHY